jgi:Carboxypeptidase regulatory-like domain/TonB dependent receptor-like, beta-barrel
MLLGGVLLTPVAALAAMTRLAFALLLCASAALAQVATLTGRITDQTGAVIPQASVTARATDTGLTTTTETTSEGYYTLPALPPGHYELNVTKQGFVPVKQTGLELTVQQVVRLDITLKVGALSETIEVQAQTPLLDSESSTVGQVIGNRQVSELPLLGRNTYALAMLVPAVRPSFGVNNLVIDQISTVSYSINGQRASANEFLLDGAPNSAPSQNQPVINANPDMVQEFKVETNNFSAEFGRSAGGVFNVVTRGGTNDLHFSLYEFLRNDKLNANDWFANRGGQPRAPFRFNQFGGTVGGPVVLPKVYNGRDRTFFFVNVELVRFVQGITFTGTTPDPSQLAGDFSGLRNASNQPIIIYDPATTRPSGTGFIRDPFPGNVIPASRIDPIARNIIRYFQRPNTAGNPITGVQNFTRTDGNRVDKNSYSIRLDHGINDSNRIFGRYSYDDTPFRRAPVYGRATPEALVASPTAGPQVFTRRNAVIDDTHTFSPTLLGSFRYSVTRLVNNRRPYSDGFDITELGLPAYLKDAIGDPEAFPAITITGFNMTGSIPNIIVGGLVGATDLIRLGNTSHAAQANLTKNLTKHTLKAGGEFRVIQFNNQQTGDTSTNFGFTPQWTQGPNPAQSTATAGSALASFLLGIGGGGVTPAPALAQSIRYWAAFVQDSWRVTPRLTLNLGIRYDYESPRVDRFDQLTNFDFDLAPPLTAPGFDLKGALAFVGVGGLPRQNAAPDRNNIAPRVGIAYRLTPKAVIRTGGGLFYSSTTGVGTGSGAFGTSGFQASTQAVTSLDGVTPVFNWSNPYPNGLNRATGSSLGAATLLGQAVSFFDRGNYTPYSFQWNFNIQYELPKNIVVEVGYAGSRGVGFSQNRELNQLPDSALALGDGLRTLVANPFFGQIQVGPLAQPTVARAQLLRPYPHFLDVTSNLASWATSNYHALEARVEKRYASGLILIASHTYSKLMDYGIGTFAGETLGGAAFQNHNNLAAEWASSTLDQTNRYVLNAVYELPFLRNSKSAVGKALGGWQVGGIWVGFSGGPLGVNANVNNTFSQGGGQRPNWDGQNPCAANPTPDQWLDRAPFSNPPAYTFGNAPRTFNGCRSDGTSQVDFTLTKNTRLAERWTLQFRAEVFNISNTPRFAPPNQAFGNAQYGVVSAQGNLPRIVQFGLKLIY